ncbi:acyltransferase [Parabacteroides sp. OttesenSCG-928-G06]|nr:acyltransferase [Parabacteroides sp. OttesenSCG-928-G06]
MFNKIKQVLKHHSAVHLIRLISRHGLGEVERLIAINWLNPFATIYLNLRSFPLKQAVRMPVWVYGRPRFYCLSGRMLIDGKLKSGMVHFNQVKSGAPSNMSVQSEIRNSGAIIFRGKCIIGTGNKIVVASKAVFDIGSDVKIADVCNIGCFSRISIGAHTRIAHRCQVLDSNYHFLADFIKKTVPKYSSLIKIGKGCWISNTTTITGGSVIPDYTIVASNSLVGKDFSTIPESSLIGGIPAKYLRSGLRRVENKEIIKNIFMFYNESPNGLFTIPEEDTPELYSYIPDEG